MSISFIIPVFNGVEILVPFLHQFKKCKGDWEIVLVDNGSATLTQNACRFLAASVAFENRITLIRNDENRGFGPANNQGAEAASYNTLVFTQSDVTFDEDLLPYLGTVKTGGALCGARLINFDSGWNFGVPYLEGWFLACTKDVWTRLGGFDERYVPADFEDVDLSMTAANKGIPLVQVHVPAAHNHPGRTWSQFSNRESVTRRNQELFKRKWGIEYGK